jgi:hypothetical protein
MTGTSSTQGEDKKYKIIAGNFEEKRSLGKPTSFLVNTNKLLSIKICFFKPRTRC